MHRYAIATRLTAGRALQLVALVTLTLAGAALGPRIAVQAKGATYNAPDAPMSEEAQIGEERHDAEVVLRKLKTQRQFTIVCMGDSVTFGLGVYDDCTDAYPALFARVLGERFRGAKVRVTRVAFPGGPADYSANFVRSHVLSRKPDLVTLQFGGTEVRMKIDPVVFERALHNLIDLLTDAGCAPLLIVPPMSEDAKDVEMMRVIRTVGRQRNVPVADFHRALSKVQHDSRGFFPGLEGLFPWWGHPDEFAHVTMAQTLYQTFCTWVGLRSEIRAAIAESAKLTHDPRVRSVEVEVNGEMKRDVEALLTLQSARLTATERLLLRGGRVKWLSLPASAPLLSAQRRTVRTPLWLTAKTAQGDLAFDRKWIAAAPCILCDELPEEARRSDQPTHLGGDNITFGKHSWDGDKDLSADLFLWHTEDQLRGEVEVTDDDLATNWTADPWQSDAVELFFDVRSSRNQGRGFYTDDVFLITVSPGQTRSIPFVRRFHGSARGSEVDRELRINGRRMGTGYVVRFGLPLGLLKDFWDSPLTSIGFDVGISDVDVKAPRQTHMLWAGTEDNFTNPAWFGAVRWGSTTRSEGLPMYRVTVH